MKKKENLPPNAAALTQNLLHLLEKGNAHASLDKALENIPLKLLGEKPDKLPYSLWQLAGHIRIAQWDILEFCRNPKHVSPRWPDGYWPVETSPKSAAFWKKCVKQIKDDRKSFIDLIRNEGADMFTPFEHGEGQSLLKEALLLADHNSYHIGEIIIIRRLLDDWD